MVLGKGVAAIAGVAYFSFYMLGLLAVGIYAYGHMTTTNAMFAYFWKRKIIFLSFVVVFLDTATDLSVMITWYDLVQAEKEHDLDFESIDMAVFFWVFIGSWTSYHAILFFMQCDSTHLWDTPLVLLQLYPFRAVYLSLKQNPAAEQERQTYAAVRNAATDTETETDADDDAVDPEIQDLSGPMSMRRAKTQNKEIGPGLEQTRLVLTRCVFETLPGLVLQSVFWAKSFNDPFLRSRDNAGLVLFSILISIFSVTTCFVSMLDVLSVTGKAKAGFLTCNPWIYLRWFYRMFSIMASLIVYVLLWVVVGGFWTALWAATFFILWKGGSLVMGEACCASWAFAHAARSMIGVSLEYPWKWHALKLVENVLGMVFVCVILYSDIEAENLYFVSLDTRLMYREDNKRIEAMVGLGWLTAIGSFSTYLYMSLHGVLDVGRGRNDTVFSAGTPRSVAARVDNSVRARPAGPY